jgi:hypothetical protein
MRKSYDFSRGIKNPYAKRLRRQLTESPIVKDKGKNFIAGIIASVQIDNVADSSKSVRCKAFVDIEASHMVLPIAWKERLGTLESTRTIQLETVTKEILKGEVCGPVRIQIEGFRPIFSEVAFVEIKPADGEYKPLIGYIVLEQSQAAVDVLGHRLVPIKNMDLK